MPTVLKFWKPYGVLTKFTDADDRPTLADYIPVGDVYPVGRLDQDSEGLLLLTDDDRLQTRLLDPRLAHPRTYLAQVEHLPAASALERLRGGVALSIDGKPYRTLPAQVDLIDGEPDLPPRPVPIRYRASIPTAWLRLTLTEGKNRQVRRMTAAVGHPTLRLVRVRMDVIDLAGLEPGAWQPLSDAERDQLWRSVFKRSSSND
ncbi:MAG: pseudouridine synthase [bacterium]|nr:pseudouridine synthase [bacterium]